jgi:hypothetical protein
MKSQFIQPEDLVVGAVVGHLTITSRKPFKQQCSCGKPCSWTKTAIVRNGVRSCGCQRRTVKVVEVKPGDCYGIFTVVEKADGPRRWVVKCSRCGNSKSSVVQNFVYNQPKRCSLCD